MIAQLVRIVGWTFFPLALLAKLPFAMSVVAVMTSVSVVTHSYGTAGFAAALVGLGTAVSGPIYGILADKYGQRPVLVFTAVTNAASLLGLGWALRASDSQPNVLLICAAALCIGCTQPQATSMVRSRWLQALRHNFNDDVPTRVTNTVLSYESMTDELVFVLGPVVVGVIATLAGVVVPLDAAAILTALGVLGIAFHPSSVYSTGRAKARVDDLGDGTPTQPTTAPMGTLLAPRVMVPVAGMLSIGLFFGSMLTSLTSFMETLGRADATGLLYGVMGVTSALFAFSVVALPDRVILVVRWMVAGAIAVAGAAILNLVPGMSGLVIALLVLGTGIGPALVTLYSIAAEVAPTGRTTAVMSMMATAVTVGQATASAVVGNLVDSSGYLVGYVAVAVATGCLLALSFPYVVVQRGRPQ